MGAGAHELAALVGAEELVVADANTGKVCRAAHHRSLGKENRRLGTPFWAEPHVVPSPTGTRAVFASDWGGGSSVDTYVLELPADPGVTLTMGTDRAAYRTGETMTTWLAVANAAHAATVDLQMFLVQPDGDLDALVGRAAEYAYRAAEPIVPAAPWFDMLADVFAGANLTDATDLLQTTRAIKTGYELEKLRLANEIAEIGMREFVTTVKPGMTEAEVGALVEYQWCPTAV